MHETTEPWEELVPDTVLGDEKCALEAALYEKN